MRLIGTGTWRVRTVLAARAIARGRSVATRRAVWSSVAATLVAISAVVLPYIVGALPLLPDEASKWLLRLTPAAGFAVKQTILEYPQVVAHYAPSAGYFPLAWWAGLAVLCGWTALALATAMAVALVATLPKTV